MIFPQMGPEYYDEKDQALLSRMSSFYAQSITINQSYWSEADTDTRFAEGDQTLWLSEWGNLPANRRRQFNFNRIRRIINMIGGQQRKTRKSLIVTPVENADAETSDQFTKIFMWLNNRENVLETISESFQGALVTGMNILHVWMDYRQDPVNGNIRIDNCSYNSFLIDPFFRKHDLSDCNFIWKRSFLSKRECIALMPDKAEEIAALHGNASGGRDNKFQFMPENYSFTQTNLLSYDEFYYRDYRTQKVLVDTQTGETLEWRHDNEEGLKQFLQMYPQVTVVDQEIPTVRLGIVVQGKVMYDGPQPAGIDQYPFAVTLAYYNPQMPYFPNRCQGVVRGLRDSQYLYNRRKVIELDILESQITSGWIYKENALVNPLDVYQQVGQGKGIALKDDAQMTDVQQVIAPQIPPSMIELSKLLGDEIQQISGVSEELLGMSSDAKAGITEMLRQGAGLTTLQILFDQLDATQKHLGDIFIDLIQANFTPGKIQKILNGKQPSPQFYNKAFGIYKAAVEDGLNTTTQRQMQYAQLLQLREAGVAIPDKVLLEAATVTNKKELVEALMEQQQQMQQQQQQQMQVQLAEMQSRIKLNEARTVADEGLGVERMSRVEENHALAEERRAAAIKDEEMGMLNLVKALKEIDTVDIDQLHKLVAIQKMMEAETAAIKTPKAPTQSVSTQGS